MRTALAAVVMITAAVGAHAQEFPTNAVPKISNPRIVAESLDMQENKSKIVARYESAGQTEQVQADVKAATVIAACSNPAAVQAALVEYKQKARILLKAALKAKIEG